MTTNLNNLNLKTDHLVDISTTLSPRNDRKDSDYVRKLVFFYSIYTIFSILIVTDYTRCKILWNNYL